MEGNEEGRGRTRQAEGTKITDGALLASLSSNACPPPHTHVSGLCLVFVCVCVCLVCEGALYILSTA